MRLQSSNPCTSFSSMKLEICIIKVVHLSLDHMPLNQINISVSLTTTQRLYSLSLIICMLPTVPFSAEERDQLKELPNKECILSCYVLCSEASLW